jgi:hypothetical protein
MTKRKLFCGIHGRMEIVDVVVVKVDMKPSTPWNDLPQAVGRAVRPVRDLHQDILSMIGGAA